MIDALRFEAGIRVKLQDEVDCNPRYKTLFYGLKKNHPQNVAVVYPTLFLVRRVIYVVCILFLTQLPYIAVVIMMLTCLAMLALVFTTSQWEDLIINQQHVINEVAFYVVLLHMTVFVGLTPSSAATIFLGWTLIASLLAIIIYNIIILIYCALQYLRLASKRVYNRRNYLRAKMLNYLKQLKRK